MKAMLVGLACTNGCLVLQTLGSTTHTTRRDCSVELSVGVGGGGGGGGVRGGGGYRGEAGGGGGRVNSRKIL